MTTAHKAVLSIVAAICLTLIVFYSVKGNATVPAAPAISTTATRNAPPRADAPATRPTALPRTGDAGPASIDEIMAKVKQLEEQKSTAAAGNDAAATTAALDADSRPSPALSNTPASTDTAPVALDEANSTGTESPATAAPDPTAGPATITPAPTTGVDPVTSSPAANTAASTERAAEVPSLTLGEPATSPDESNTAGKHRSVFETDVQDLAKLPAINDPLPVPALAKVDPPADAGATKDETTSPAAPAPAASAKATDATITAEKSAGTTPEPKVVLIDPHKPAVANDAASTQPETARANDAALPSTSTSTNTLAEAPRRTPLPEHVKPLDDPRAATRATDAAAPRTYTIKAGDTFSSIAIATYGAEKHWIDIADANPTVDPKKVRVGQVIKLPELDKDDAKPAEAKAAVKITDTKVTDAKTNDVKTDAKSAAKTTEKKPDPAKAEARIHEVKPGENLIAISRRYYKTGDNWRHIYLTNRELIGGDPAKLQAGMKLKITPPPLED